MSFVSNYLEDSVQDALRYLRDMSFQAKCKFSLTLIRNPLDSLRTGGVSLAVNLLDTAIGAAGAFADVQISKYFVESIQFPGGAGFEYERVNGKRHVKNITYPDTISMVLRENEEGLVRRYITEWQQNIATPYRPSSPLAAINPLRGFLPNSRIDPREGSYEFADNQEAAKRTGILLLKPTDGSTPKYPRYMFYGLCLQEQPQYDLNQGDGEYLTHSITLSVDEVKTPLLF